MSGGYGAVINYSDENEQFIDDEENNNAEEQTSQKPTLLQEMVAECIGTCILTQVGCAGLCASTYIGAYDGLWQAAIVWLLGAALAISATASISGAHLNPAVTLAFGLVRCADFNITKVIPYWIAQLAGGIIAGFINLTIFQTSIVKYESANNILRGTESGIKSASAFGDYYMLSEYVPTWNSAVFIEAFGTAFLVFCIFAITHPKNKTISDTAVPFAVGAAIAVMIATLGPLTGSAINPARDLGPRLITYFYGWGPASLQGAEVYIIGPLLGGPIGAIIADGILY